MRLAIIYKYGGWYSDLDTVWLRPLSSLSPPDVDVISTDGYLDKVLGKERDDQGHRILGSGVSNGLFRFRSERSPFLRRSMQLFVSRFDPKVWTSGGARVMATALKEACGVEGQHVALTG